VERAGGGGVRPTRRFSPNLSNQRFAAGLWRQNIDSRDLGGKISGSNDLRAKQQVPRLRLGMTERKARAKTKAKGKSKKAAPGQPSLLNSLI
jgi:hypothetical protein